MPIITAVTRTLVLATSLLILLYLVSLTATPAKRTWVTVCETIIHSERHHTVRCSESDVHPSAAPAIHIM